MASSINATTSSGVVTTADNSGILNLQSNGVTQATISSSGLSLPNNATLNTANTFGFKNRFINGSFNINQYNLGTVTPTGNQYIIDRWFSNVTTASKYSVAQSTVAPAGFTNSALITSTSAYSVVAGDYESFQQRIEANNMTDIGWGTANAKTVTLSFWVNCSLTGTFGGSLYFPASTTRTYPFSYTISSANTWQQISVTIPGDTVTNTAPTGTNIYVLVQWSLGAGSTYTTSTTGWQNGNFLSPTGCTNLVGTSGATLYITGAQLEVGSQATSFDFRSFGTELGLCQRYFYKTFALGTAPASGAGQVGALICPQGAGGSASGNAYSLTWQFKVPMRTAPTISLYNTNTTGSNWYDSSGSSATTSGATNTSEFSTMIYNVSAAATANVNAVIHATASAEL